MLFVKSIDNYIFVNYFGVGANMLKKVLFVISLLLLSSISSAQNNNLPNGQEIYNQLKNLELYPNQVASVQNLTLQKDVATFNFIEGKIYILQPVLGKTTGLVFIGEGTFQFTPPTEMERYQLEKFTDNENLSVRFAELYLRFTDKTREELESKLQFVAGEVEGKAKDINGDSRKRALKVLNKNVNARVLEDLLFAGEITEGSLAAGFFYADIKARDERRLFFIFDPKNIEEVALYRDNPKLADTEFDMVCSFHKEADYKEGNPDEKEENKDEINPKHYKLEVHLETNGMMQLSCELSFVPLVEGIRAIPFQMDQRVEIKKQLKSDSNQVVLIAEKGEYGFVAVFPHPLKANQEEKLLVSDSAEILDRNYFGMFFIESTVAWFPRYGFNLRSTYDLTFKTPKDYKFISVGEKIKEWTEGRYLYTHWKHDFPSKMVSFNLGYFDIYQEKKEGLPEVIVYWNDDFHHKLSMELLKEGYVVATGKDMKKRIAADVLNSLNFFQNAFGPYPFNHLFATEIPAYHGQAFTGLLHLSWLTFQAEEKFEEESFRAHEVSHQWWGHMVGWKSYHDQWLSEGFAEYSGAWFAQNTLKDNKKFFGQLKNWRGNIVGGHKVRQSDGSKAGPLWLGRRLNSSKSYDYSTLVYEKGAFVLHMLRNMLMDFKTFSDDKFIEMLKDYFQSHYGKNATTSDFQQIVEKHLEQDMDWFFKQWVYGIEIPKYIYSYSTEKVGDKYQVTVKVRQEKVAPDFKMQVPVVVVYKQEGYSIFRVWVDKPEVEVKLPPVSMEVKEIVFNPFESVLAEVEEKK